MEILMTRNKTKMSPSNLSSPLSLHKDSQTISKPKPKIRIIHVFAPEIIKTDAANFRELVQRLTGKPPQEKGCPRKPIIVNQDDSFCGKPAMATAKNMFLAGFERVKEEEGVWSNIGENFLSGFGDFDGLIQELGVGGEFPLDASSHLMHGFEEVQLIA
ncbi:hypothetical protein HRI_000140600 [Hibiscus trionum]|uniref:VQ domain-containing protein n=1 Tax=Hibiscus trionum TaxID=183268 RepID=A0A9W7LH29_HIBTR|nr:hypothetical protein HRI_000140600 [Hibiscus trionum]